ncbi:MAG: protein kinase, partial [Myxococcota bacterium]|nr:protein kinase [Myxococcota bacterium]
MELVGGRYEVTRSLAGGGMGSVCEAIDRVMGRRVALKTLHPHLAAEESLCERFRREALAAAALAHPHIAQATDYGVDPKHGPFLVMELLVGEALSERLARDGAFVPERAVFVAAQALDALAAAHDAGIVHRDIKPSNLFLTQLSGVADVVKVIDFGIAKLYESKTWQRLTATGQVIGTPTYMAPEQALGRPIDPRVDVYAMGLVLYGMLTGRPAFRPGGPETIVPILEGRYVPIRALAPHVDSVLAEVVARAMHVDREARFPDARAMRDALAPWLPSTVSSLHASRPPSAVSSVPPAALVSDDATRGPARRASGSPSAPPLGSAPSHSAPSHSAPSHSAPSHSAPSHAAPSHAAPSHAAPSHAAPSHSAPSHSAPSHSAPSHSAPSHSAPS